MGQMQELSNLLCTVEKVGVPAVVPPYADVVRVVVRGSAVCVPAAVFALILVAVVVALVAHLPFAAINPVWEVALDFIGVVQQVVAVLIVAHQVGPMAPRAMPVLPEGKKWSRKKIYKYIWVFQTILTCS